MLSVATLNLWGYFDWENRKERIVRTINGLSPDVVALQEVQTNGAFSSYPQSDFVAEGCNFKYRVFAPTYRRSGQIDREGKKTREASYGLAFLSRHPIVSIETYFLQQHPDRDEACSVLFVTLDINGVATTICNVHFANSDLSSDLHLKELMQLCAERRISPIILGDFNHFRVGEYRNTQLKGYVLSTDVAHYESMPKDRGTLDYIAVPADDYAIKAVICPEEYVSDHRMVFAEIARKN